MDKDIKTEEIKPENEFIGQAEDSLRKAVQNKIREKQGLPPEEEEQEEQEEVVNNDTTSQSRDDKEGVFNNSQKPEHEDIPEEQNDLQDELEEESEVIEEESGDDRDQDVDQDTAQDEVVDKEGQDKVPEDEIDWKEDRNNPTNPKKTKKSIERLLGEIQRLKSEVKKGEEVAEKLKELEKANEDLSKQVEESAGSKITEEEREELLKLRRMMELENDPEIIEKYASKQETATEAAKAILLRNGLPEKAFKITNDDGEEVEGISWEAIERVGGMAKYVQKYPDVYNTLVEALERQNKRDAVQLDLRLAELENIEIDRKREIEKATKDAKEYFKQRAEKEKEKASQTAEERRKREEEILTWHKKVSEELFKPVPVPADATDKQKAEAKRINDTLKDQEKFLLDAVQVEDLEDRKQVALAAASYVQIRLREQDLEAQIKEKDIEIARLRKAIGGGKRRAVPTTKTNSKEPAPSSYSFRDAVENKIKERLGRR